MSAPRVDVVGWFDDYIRRCGAYDDGTPIRAAVAELIAADRAFDKAKDDIAAAKKAKGSWSVNPLGHNHPAVLAMREASERRATALARIGASA